MIVKPALRPVYDRLTELDERKYAASDAHERYLVAKRAG